MQSIKKNREFRFIYSAAKSYADRNLVIHFIKNDTSVFRYGVSVSSKVGHAVVRNKIKRRIKAILRLNEDNIKNNYDIIFVVRVRAKEASYADLSQSVKFLLTRNRLLVNEDKWVY